MFPCSQRPADWATLVFVAIVWADLPGYKTDLGGSFKAWFELHFFLMSTNTKSQSYFIKRMHT